MRWDAFTAVCLFAGLLIFAVGSDSAPVKAATPTKNWCGTPISVPNDGPGDMGPTVVITGVVTKRQAWAPAGFGNYLGRDYQWTAWFLKLDSPLSVFLLDDHDLPAGQTIEREVQLRGKLESNGGYREFLNRHVAVQGRFWRASGPADLGDITVNMTEVHAVKGVRCEMLVPAVTATEDNVALVTAFFYNANNAAIISALSGDRPILSSFGWMQLDSFLGTLETIHDAYQKGQLDEAHLCNLFSYQVAKTYENREIHLYIMEGRKTDPGYFASLDNLYGVVTNSKDRACDHASTAYDKR